VASAPASTATRGGAADTIRRLTSAFDEVVRTDPFAPRVRVHDLSLQNGGPMPGHKSHQWGRDVDITYYQHGCPEVCGGRHVAPSELDAPRQWRLLRQWLERNQAEFIFIDYALQRPLYKAASANGASARELAQWFQYPRGPKFPAGIVRHVPNHANHVHMRFRCAPQDRVCKGTAPWRVLAPGVMGSSSLFELIWGESEDEELLLQLAERRADAE
jgi:murein endopeptidase